MNGCGQSDGPVVPANPPNKAAAAEAGEERGPAKGNTASRSRPGRSAGLGVSSALDRVREVAVRDRQARFTALLHHVSLDRLRDAFWAINPKAAPGVDRVTWATYEQNLEVNLRDLHERVQAGRYRASPSRRVYIPKADGRQRPLGVATDDSYCPSCNRVSGCSVMVRVCAGQGRIRGFAGVIMSGSADG
jgi:RNA-directed DNA polymerase